MLNQTHHLLLRLLLLAGLYAVGSTVAAQQSVGVLRLDMAVPADRSGRTAADVAPVHRFTFDRNLIFFHALVDGRPGNFILDTGAPSLILNDRGRGEGAASLTGLGAGGEVALSEHHVARFEMGGQAVTNYRAIALDLRPMEARTERRIDGFVGYDLINSGELRIDYAAETFQLLPSSRKPTLAGRAPRAVFRFMLVDHLPVIRLKIGGKWYCFALDTGAGANLLDSGWLQQHTELATATPDRMDVQGLDGAGTVAPIVSLQAGRPTATDTAAPIDCVVMDLSHLQDGGGVQLAGILGSAFLSQYTVAIDYRRRKVYFW